MTRDDVIRMAHEAGAAQFYPAAQSTKDQNYLVGAGFLERFAALIAAAEREACAKVCEDLSNVWKSVSTVSPVVANSCASAIRARGNQ